MFNRSWEKVNERYFGTAYAGEPISADDPEFETLTNALEEARHITAELNLTYHSPEEVRQIVRKLGVDIDDTATIRPPFYADFGKSLHIGARAFINQLCCFMSRGNITIEEDVKIGPRVNLITLNHGTDPAERRIITSQPIHIKRNAWLGAAVTVMPGVTIGENSIVGAGAVVTHDVPDNVIVAGVPARFIKNISDKK